MDDLQLIELLRARSWGSRLFANAADRMERLIFANTVWKERVVLLNKSMDLEHEYLAGWLDTLGLPGAYIISEALRMRTGCIYQEPRPSM